MTAHSKAIPTHMPAPGPTHTTIGVGKAAPHRFNPKTGLPATIGRGKLMPPHTLGRGKTAPCRPPPRVSAAEQRAIEEVRLYQSTTNLLIPKRVFQHLVRAIAQECVSGNSYFDESGVRFQSPALMALQEAAESYLVGLLEESGWCATHAGRTTLMPSDLDLARRIRG